MFCQELCEAFRKKTWSIFPGHLFYLMLYIKANTYCLSGVFQFKKHRVQTYSIEKEPDDLSN